MEKKLGFGFSIWVRVRVRLRLRVRSELGLVAPISRKGLSATIGRLADSRQQTDALTIVT